MPSQYGEDNILIDFFKGKRNGFLVDIGAADGIVNSNSYILINDYNWGGILIEPHKNYFKKLLALYSKNIKIKLCNQAVWDSVCEKDFFIFGKDDEAQVSTLSEEFKHKVIYQHGNKYLSPTKVKCNTLENILTTFQSPYNIDFMSIDCEGAEIQAINSLNWSLYNIQLICVEHSMLIEQLYNIMEKNGYKFYTRTTGNTFFVPDSY